MIIYLYTSGKGGVGKTVCALSTALNYLGKSDTGVLCIDLNWENADFGRIMQMGGKTSPGNKFLRSTIPGAVDSLVLRPATPFTIASGAAGFWTSLSDAIHEASRYITPKIVIVDTGLHFANLIRRNSTNTIKTCLDKINLLVSNHRVNEINIWFVWTLSAMLGDEHTSAISTTINHLRDNFKDSVFDEKNFINIINPYAVYPISHWFKTFGDGFRSMIDKKFTLKVPLSNLVKMSNADVANPLSFNEFQTTINKLSKEFSRKESTNTQGFLNALALELLKTNKQMRPKNIFPFPVYDSSIVNYIDNLVREEPKTISAIQDDIKPILDPIKKYLSEL